MKNHTRKRWLALAFLIATSASRAAQTKAAPDENSPLGVFEPAFNHEVPEAWKKGQAGWDGEPDSPYRYPESPTRFMAAHLSLIPRGPYQGWLLTWNQMRVLVGEQYWAILDPVNKTFLNYSVPSGPEDEDWFCSGHAWTKDGDLFVAGGNKNINGWISASKKTYRFVPSNELGSGMWVREADLAIPRWYPTVTNMGSDSLLVIGGTRDTAGRKPFNSFESFDPSPAPGAGLWQSDPKRPEARVFPGPSGLKRSYMFGFYPRTHLLSDGSLFFSGMSGLSYRLNDFDPEGKQAPSWDLPPQNPFLSYLYSSSVLLPNLGGPGGPYQDMVLRTAGVEVPVVRHIPQIPPFVPGPPYGKASAKTHWIRAGLRADDEQWKWNSAGSLEFKRARADATLLPDGTLIATGGKLDTEVEINCGVPVMRVEIFDVESMSWRTDARARVRRGYHSSVALLPDGRVMLAGGEGREMDYEIYRPPYLTDGSLRPEILDQAEHGAAWEWGYATEISVGYKIEADVQVIKAVLMAPASTTHHSDVHQRYVELETLPQKPGDSKEPAADLQLRFRTPPDSNHAPRGYYMLFLITEKQGQAATGTPSEAAWVHLN